MSLNEFRQVQRELAAVVQDAMKYGPDPVLNEKFRKGRAWVQAHYSSVRHSFDPVWTTSDDPRRFPGQHTDPFESLFSSPTLEGLLKRDTRQIRRDLEDIETAFELCWESEVSLA